MSKYMCIKFFPVSLKPVSKNTPERLNLFTVVDTG